jgi:hypothetical protein
MLEECSAARFRFSESPSLLRTLELVLSGAHANDSSELSTLQKSAELLNVGAEAMIVTDHYHSPGLFSGRKDSFHPVRRERQGPLTQHMNFRAQGAQHVRLVQMIRSSDNYRIEPVMLEKLLDVREHIGNAESLREGARFHSVVVADRNERRAFDFREHRKMRELRNRAGTDKRESQIGRRRAIYLNELATRWSSGAPRCQSMRPTVVPG